MQKQFRAVVMDMDGLIVDTELLHFEAYGAMCYSFGYILPWTFAEYMRIAGSSSTAIKDQLRLDIPALFETVSWEEMYTMKRQLLLKKISDGPIPLMDGFLEGLLYFYQKNIPIAVVTHSSLKVVALVKDAHPILKNIPIWIGREQYQSPKPHPDGYMLSLNRLRVMGEDTVGFEDTFRGIVALTFASIHPILINNCDPVVQDTCKAHKIQTYSRVSDFCKSIA